MGRSITITGMARPHLFRDTLVWLRANELEGWKILIGIEPTPRSAEFSEIAREVLAGCDWSLTVNEQVLGIQRHPHDLIERAFAGGSSLNLYLEEDLHVAPDATALALWYDRNHKPGWVCLNLLAAACGSGGVLSNPAYPDLVFEARTFNALGFAVRPQEWRTVMASAWKPLPRVKSPVAWGHWRSQFGWDWSIYGKLAVDASLRTVQPVLARSNHTGREGEFCHPEFHDVVFAGLPVSDGAARAFRLVATDELPSEVRAHVRIQNEMTELLRTFERAVRKRYSWQRIRASVGREFKRAPLKWNRSYRLVLSALTPAFKKRPDTASPPEGKL